MHVQYLNERKKCHVSSIIGVSWFSHGRCPFIRSFFFLYLYNRKSPRTCDHNLDSCTRNRKNFRFHGLFFLESLEPAFLFLFLFLFLFSTETHDTVFFPRCFQVRRRSFFAETAINIALSVAENLVGIYRHSRHAQRTLLFHTQCLNHGPRRNTFQRAWNFVALSTPLEIIIESLGDYGFGTIYVVFGIFLWAVRI